MVALRRCCVRESCDFPGFLAGRERIADPRPGSEEPWGISVQPLVMRVQSC